MSLPPGMPAGARGPLGPPPQSSGPPSSPLALGQGGHGPTGAPPGPARPSTGGRGPGGPPAPDDGWRRPRHGPVGAGFVAVVAIAVVLVLVAVSLVVVRLVTHGDDEGAPASTHTQPAATTPVGTHPVSPGGSTTPQTGPKSTGGTGAVVSVAGQCRYLAAEARGPVAPAPPSLERVPSGTAMMVIQTSGGVITAELDAALAPCAVYALRHLAGVGYYDDSLCPRQTDGPNEAYYILQCGDPTGTGSGAPGFAYEAEHPPSDFRRGVIAVVRGSSGRNGGQFVISYADPTNEGREEMADRYTVVGHVIDGLDVLDGLVAPGVEGSGGDGAPASDARIRWITVES